jgi:hypothetical protein
VNASVGDDALVVHHRIHLGIAVDLDQQGLIVPVIHDAADLRLASADGGREVGPVVLFDRVAREAVEQRPRPLPRRVRRETRRFATDGESRSATPITVRE